MKENCFPRTVRDLKTMYEKGNGSTYEKYNEIIKGRTVVTENAVNERKYILLKDFKEFCDKGIDE